MDRLRCPEYARQPMRQLGHEFLVGLLALFAIVAAVFAVMRTDDRPDGVGGSWTVYALFPAAEGVYPDTPVRVAGVPVGSVDAVVLLGGQAKVTIIMQGDVELPIDSVVELKGEGILGDKYLRVTPGSAGTNLADGDTIKVGSAGPDLDQLTAKMALIADDVKVITANVRTMTSDEGTQGELKATLANIEALSEQLRAITAANQDDLAAITSNLKDVSASLKAVVGTTGSGINEELAAIKTTTESLDRTIGHLESITGKIEGGEGSLGKLVNDSTTVDGVNTAIASINDTVSEVQGMVKDISRIQTEVYYRGSAYYGTDPTSGAFVGNPVSGATRNIVGVRLIPKPDYWYVFEYVSHPQGLISYEDHVYPDLGSSYREYTVAPSSRFTFQFAKRWKDLVFRFGLKESSGGIGVDGMLFHDRLQLTADLYDFTYGSWPVMDGTPELQLYARAYPWKHVYVEGGLDNAILGAKYGFVTGFAGGGFSFTDDDLKFVLAALPISP